MQLFDLDRRPVIDEPFAHVFDERFVAPDVYDELRANFPECPPSSGPTGFSLYWGDADYERLLEKSAAWRSLFEAFHSQAFIEWGVAQFANSWNRDFSNARYVPYREDRIDKERLTLRKIEHAPDELWVRMDIHQGREGYARKVHVDHRRRLISLLFYLSDHEEHGLKGGELLMHKGRYTRWLHRPAVVKPRHNLMVAFPCTGDSWHSVPEITAAAKPRNYIQVHISSSVDVW